MLSPHLKPPQDGPLSPILPPSFMWPGTGARLLPLPHRRHFSLIHAAAVAARTITSRPSTAPMSTHASSGAYETLQVEKHPTKHTAIVRLHRPEKRNAMNSRFWQECRAAFETLGEDGDVRGIVLCGAGKVFSSGLDLGDIGIDLVGGGGGGMDAARKGLRIKRHVTMVCGRGVAEVWCMKVPSHTQTHTNTHNIKEATLMNPRTTNTKHQMQEAFNAIERAPQPVVSAIHGACIGGAIDMVAACDVRLASAETVFSIKVHTFWSNRG